jgi:hypothetical protein
VRLFSYVVARDYGFAPNPFHGVCTLATCKPEIRRLAAVGDWVVGTGSASRKRKGYFVFAMKVAEAMSFQQYFDDPRLQMKKPNLLSGKKNAFGDNIYSHGKYAWNQLNCHDSHADGSPNQRNIDNDTQADRVLVGTEYIYWGRSGPAIPKRFRDYNGFDICAGRGHKSKFPDKLVADLVAWLNDRQVRGFVAEPLDWDRSP